MCVETDNFIDKMKEQDEIQHVKDLVVLFLICEYTSILKCTKGMHQCKWNSSKESTFLSKSWRFDFHLHRCTTEKKNQIVFSKRMTSERESKIVPSSSNLPSHQSYVNLILRADIYFRGSWQAYLWMEKWSSWIGRSFV